MCAKLAGPAVTAGYRSRAARRRWEEQVNTYYVSIHPIDYPRAVSGRKKEVKVDPARPPAPTPSGRQDHQPRIQESL